MHNDADARADSTRPVWAEDLGLSAHANEEGLNRLVQLLARVAHAPMAAFWVFEREDQYLAAAHGLASREIPATATLAEYALRQDDVFVVEDAAADLRFSADPMVTTEPKLRAFAGIAIRGRDRQRVGVLCLMDTRVRGADDATRAALQDLRVVLEERLRLRSDVLHDPQTGALTRRHFDEMADREWRRGMRAMVPVSVIVAELDGVHAFARREGAAALDRGLRAAVLAMQYSLHRPGDCVCRHGDTRFVMLLPGTDENGALETAERVRSAIAALMIPFADAPGGTLTLSAGVETTHSEALSRGDITQSMRSAAQALREAQAAGGNRWNLVGTAAVRVPREPVPDFDLDDA